MAELPRRSVTRSAKLASLPLGFAGRATIGLGKRVGGRPADQVAAEVQARTAEQIFRVLGELKGGAMKFGQALSMFEAAMPEELAAPYRATLTKLQEAAPPLEAASVHEVLVAELGHAWRDRFARFEDVPVAAASIGQVHQAVWRDGRPVAVKIQYPGAGPALMADLTQLGRLGRLFGSLMPGLDIRPLINELKERMAEELDYTLEADNQRGFAKAYAGHPDIAVPDVVAATDRVIISEWVSGTPLSRIIRTGDAATRDRAGLLLARFLFSGPGRAGLLHADPHPGNYRMLADGRLGVLDFGAVKRLPDGLPTSIGPLLRVAMNDDAQGLLDGLRGEGFVRRGGRVDAVRLLDYLRPFLEPVKTETFTFSRPWLRGLAARVTDPRNDLGTRLQLNLPAAYLLIYRVTLGAMAVLSQLESTGPFRAELERWLPGFAAP